MHASCTCFMFISVLGFSWPIPRSDRLFTQLCASWEYHEHALCLSMTWPCNSPMKSAKLRFSLELLWRELLWWKLLWCSELLCALPALHPTSMRSMSTQSPATPHGVWLQMAVSSFYSLLTKWVCSSLTDSANKMTLNLFMFVLLGKCMLSKKTWFISELSEHWDTVIPILFEHAAFHYS